MLLAVKTVKRGWCVSIRLLLVKCPLVYCYTHPDDHNLPNYDMTPGFKPFTVSKYHFLFVSVSFPRITELIDLAIWTKFNLLLIPLGCSFPTELNSELNKYNLVENKSFVLPLHCLYVILFKIAAAWLAQVVGR